MSLNQPKRPSAFLQEKAVLQTVAVAAVSATTTLALATMDADFVVDSFEVEVPGGYTSDATNYYDLSLQLKPQTFTAVASTDVCTATGHKLETGDAIQVTNAGGGLPAGLTAGVTYFVIKIDADTFKLADSAAHAAAGTAINITTNGTGTQSIAKVFAMYSLLASTGNGDLTTLVFGAATMQPNPTGLSGQQLNAVLTKVASGANLAAGTRLVAHCHLL